MMGGGGWVPEGPTGGACGAEAYALGSLHGTVGLSAAGSPWPEISAQHPIRSPPPESEWSLPKPNLPARAIDKAL